MGQSQMMRTALLIVTLCCTCLCHAGGTLVIAGGALGDGEPQVLGAFAAALAPEGPVVVVPAASSRPARSARNFARALARAGVDPARIKVYPLAVLDDSSTAGVDESLWSGNAWHRDQLAGLQQAAGFWFTGGDQMRIVESLRSEDLQESPLLELIRRRLEAGAVVGGTSAGAAVMSEVMIAGGDSFTSLLEPLAQSYASTEDQDSGRLYLARGLGFIPAGIIDQHFDRKARLGRLVRAMAESGQVRGYGVDEDTAMVVDLRSGEARVVGSGGVTLLDAGSAQYDLSGIRIMSGCELSIAASGVRFSLEPLKFIDGYGTGTVGEEYYKYKPLQGGGMALANPLLDQLLGYDLLDNASSTQLQRYSFDESGRLLIYTFTETGSSEGFLQSAGASDRYSVSRVRFDIRKGNIEQNLSVPETGKTSIQEKSL
jgi:cyanophycinase